MKSMRLLGILLTALLIFTACGGEKTKKQLSIAYANWAEGIAVTHLTKAIFEEQGYEVKLQNADIAPIFASLSRGKVDIFMDIWMPVTHADYLNQYSENLDSIGTIYNKARIGLVVPEYVTINSIEELNDNKKKFSGQVIGIDAGAGIMKATEKAIDDYKLEYKLLTSSGPGMTASLKKAIEQGKWIVVTGWTPHWMFDRFKLKILEDPKKVYGEAETIQIASRKDFGTEDEFAATLLGNIHLTDKQISSLMTAMEETLTTEDDAAQEWLEKNRELVNSWIPQAKD